MSSELDGLTPDELRFLKTRKKAAEKEYLRKRSSVKWNDLPPVLDVDSPVTQAILENAVEDGNAAKVGDTWLEFGTQIQAKICKPISEEDIPVPYEKRHQEEDSEDTEDETLVIIKRGYRVWQVIQPKWTKEDQGRIDKIHEKYAAVYKQKEEYRSFYEQKSTRRWPEDRFPNNLYWTERWLPKVWHDEQKEWLPASEEDCKNWYNIPEEKRRVDYLVGVLPDE